MTPTELEEGHQRRHPHRLDASQYHVPGHEVGFILCAARRRPVLALGNAPELIVDAMHFNARNNGVRLIAWCLMPDHLHVVAQVEEDDGDLLKFVNGLKKRTGKTLRGAGLASPVWQRSFWDRHLREKEYLSDLVAYVVNNPVEAGLCERWYEWPHVWIDDAPEAYLLPDRGQT